MAEEKSFGAAIAQDIVYIIGGVAMFFFLSPNHGWNY